ncbi:hypothetical protein [Lewinella sp. LCG006]|uniref:hypothetical protein n=1 Tax=Lewinella sp. LCG006 TaxID=3231911 RepID=UPI00345FDA12
MEYNFIYYGKRNGLEIFYDDIPEELSISTIIAALGVDTYKINIQSQSPMLRFQRVEVAPAVWRDIISWYEFSLDNRNRRGYHALSLVFEPSPGKSNLEYVLRILKQGVVDAEGLKDKTLTYEEAYKNLITPPKISKKIPPRSATTFLEARENTDQTLYLAPQPIFVLLPQQQWGIPALEALFQHAAQQGLQDLIISKVDVVEGQSYHTFSCEQFLAADLERTPLFTTNYPSTEQAEEESPTEQEEEVNSPYVYFTADLNGVKLVPPQNQLFHYLSTQQLAEIAKYKPERRTLNGQTDKTCYGLEYIPLTSGRLSLLAVSKYEFAHYPHDYRGFFYLLPGKQYAPSTDIQRENVDRIGSDGKVYQLSKSEDISERKVTYFEGKKFKNHIYSNKKNGPEIALSNVYSELLQTIQQLKEPISFITFNNGQSEPNDDFTTKNTLRFKDKKIPLAYTDQDQYALIITKDKKENYTIATQVLKLRLLDTDVDFFDQNNNLVKSRIKGNNNYLYFKIGQQPIQAQQLKIHEKDGALKNNRQIFGTLTKTNQKVYTQASSNTESQQVHLEPGMQVMLYLPAEYPILLKEKSGFSLSALWASLRSPHRGSQAEPDSKPHSKKAGSPLPKKNQPPAGSKKFKPNYTRIMLALLLGVLLAAAVKYLTNKTFTPPGSTTTEQTSDLQSPPIDTPTTTKPPIAEEPEPPAPPIELSEEEKVLYEEARAYRITARAELNAKTYDGVRKIFDRVKIENYISQLGGITSPPREVTKLIEELYEINNDYFQNGYSKKEYELIIHKVKINPKTNKPETSTDIATQRKVTVEEIIKYNPNDVDKNGRISKKSDGSLPTLVIYRKLD